MSDKQCQHVNKTRWNWMAQVSKKTAAAAVGSRFTILEKAQNLDLEAGSNAFQEGSNFTPPEDCARDLVKNTFFLCLHSRKIL